MSVSTDNTRSNPVSRSVPWLGAGLAVSLLLHLSVGVLLVRSASPTLQIRTPTQEVRADEPVRPRLRLGLEESTVASINWLGFADPTEHAAPVLFELDQAALTRNASVPTPPDAALPVEVPRSPVPDETAPDVAEPNETELKQAEPSTAAAAPETPPAPDRDSPIVIRPPAETQTTKPKEPKPEESESEESESDAEDSVPEQPAANLATPAPTGPVVPASTPPSPSAVPDDRDSTPTATEMSLTLDHIGKPAAGEGVELKTVWLGSQDKAVRFLAGSLKNPVVTLEFRREKEGPATASHVEFVRDEQPDGTFITRGTGNPDIDRILRLNFYRWTATGKAINELEIGKTLQIRLTIRLH
ncbi:MAG: hypothetical protein ACI89L_002224 [Phycisphaerales bacterium]